MCNSVKCIKLSKKRMCSSKMELDSHGSTDKRIKEALLGRFQHSSGKREGVVLSESNGQHSVSSR